MTTPIVIPGLTNSFKVPGAFRESLYGQGKVSIGAIPIKIVVTGTKTTTGSATPDLDIVDIYSEDDADTYLGVGSEIACQCYAALQIPGINLKAAPVLENASGVAGSLTVTITGTWSTTGTLAIYLAGRAIQATVGAADDVTAAAVSLVGAINGAARLPFTASNAAGVVTIVTRSKGVRMNDYLCRKDLSAAPSGLAAALVGGTATTGGMTPFASGAGADDVAPVLALMATDIYDIQAWAQNDTTNAALIKAALTSEAGSLIMHLEHAVFGKRGTLSAATTFSSTTLNAYRCSTVWMENCEQAPSYVAAQAAAKRASIIGDNPNYRFDDVVMPSIPGHSQKADIPLVSELNTALNNGVTPLTTNPDGTVKIVRAIQSHCLSGSAPDYRTLDWGDVDVPDRLSKEAGAQWTVFALANQYVGPDPAEGEEPLPEGTGSPKLWNADLYELLKDAETANWIQDVDANLPVSVWNSDAKRIMTAMPAVVRAQNHSVGISVRQTAA